MHGKRTARIVLGLLVAALGAGSCCSHSGRMLLGMTLYHAAAILLPVVCFTAIAMRWGISNRITALAIGGCGSGIVVYAGFWCWVVAPWAGLAFNLFTWTVLLSWLAVRLRRRAVSWPEVRVWVRPVGLWICYALFILAAGLAPTGTHDVLSTVARRFSHALPFDNQLPYIFARQLVQGGIHVPMAGDWLSSDRPPLQTAYFLASGTAVSHDRRMHYQVHATLLQCLWVLALWALLRARPLSRFSMGLAMGVPMLSGVAVLHGLFTWPKLLPVFHVLLIVGILFEAECRRLRDWRVGVVTGCLAGLAMLSHGASVFVLLGIGLALLLTRRMPKRVFTGTTVAVGVCLLLTWSCYQRFLDPPGNRLVKWHFAGVVPIDKRSTVQTLADSYGGLSWRAVAGNKAANLATLFGQPAEWGGALVCAAAGLSDPAARGDVRAAQFLCSAAALGVFCLAPLAFVLKRRDMGAWGLGVQLLVLSLCTAFVWVILLFGPHDTVIHQGSLALPVFLYCGTALVIGSTSRIVASLLALLHVLVFLQVYYLDGMGFREPGFDTVLFAMSVASLLILSVLLAFMYDSETTVAQVAPGDDTLC